MINRIVKKILSILMMLAIVLSLLPAVMITAKAVNATFVQDASRSNNDDAGKAILTSIMPDYKANEADGSSSTVVNYVGNIAAWGFQMESALKFELPATSSILSSAKLHLPVVNVKNSPTATVTLPDINSWQQTDDLSTSIYPSLVNATTLLSNQLISSSGDVSLSLDTTELQKKIVSSGTSVITLIVTGSTTSDNYFNFIADDDASTDQASLVLTFKPQVQSVSVPSIGTYKIGDALNFTVTFDSDVIVTGTPRIPVALNTGGTVYASYVSGSNSKNLVFRYTVSSGYLDADGISLGSAINLNSGTIKTSGNDDAELNLYSVAATTGVLVDGFAPTINSVSPPGDATYYIGDDLDYTVYFSEPVYVVTTGGTPYLTLTLGSTTIHAAYNSGSGTNALTFRYTVAAGDTDADGVALSSDITLNGGMINDAAGNSAALTFTGSAAAGVKVASAPTVTTPDTVSYTDTAGSDTFNNNTGTLSASDIDGTVTSYGITGGTTGGSTDIGGIVYDVSKGGTYGTLYVKSSTGQYVFVPSAPTINAVSANQSETFTVTATDNGGAIGNATLTVSITGDNDTPTDIALSSSSVSENVAGNTTVGTLSSTDADSGNTFTYTLVAGAGSTDNTAFNISGSSLRITNSPDRETKSSYSVRVRTTDQTNLWYEESFTITISDVNEAPVITTGAAISVTEGSTAAFTAAATDPEGSALTWSITGGADAVKFSVVAGTGVVTFGTAPSFASPTDADAHNDYVLQITVSDGAMTTMKEVTVTVTQQAGIGGGGGSSSGGSGTSAQVIVNGETQTAGTTETSTTADGQTVTTVTVDTDKLEDILEAEGAGATVIIPVAGGADVAAGTLTGEMVKNMEDKDATLVIHTDSGTYTIPAAEINIDAVSEQLGANVSLSDISVTVSISEPPASMTQVVENAAQDGGFTIMVPAVDYTITCTYGDQTVNVSSFNAYVERTIAIPDGVDPSKITTGVVVDPDGTVHHVPTRVTMINGKYYAVINSLTNSTYSVIWNPLEFADVTDHWAKDAINDMGSRMVVTGVGNNNYDPDRSMTRAEFATIIIRALGLEPGSGESSFNDVEVTDWYCGYIKTAASYGIIRGYDNGGFGPNDTITREQAMTMIERAMTITKLKINLTDSEVNQLLSAFEDGASASIYAKNSIAACLKAGITSGTTDSMISPKADITRAEVAVMVQRLLQKSGLI